LECLGQSCASLRLAGLNTFHTPKAAWQDYVT
jgi:hypothetical protein